MEISSNANSIVVLDFETTGLSPNLGDRAIEIGAIKLVNGVVVDSFQSLMNPGRPIDSFIESYTGITNKMLENAPSCQEVMTQFTKFIQGYNLLAHNASFDKRFLDAELSRLSLGYDGTFTCSLLLARRLYQEAPNHKLGSLINYKNIETTGDFHRALYDSEMTAKLWLVMLNDIQNQTQLADVPFSLILKINKTSKAKIESLLSKLVD